jgi:hypothetical protein
MILFANWDKNLFIDGLSIMSQLDLIEMLWVECLTLRTSFVYFILENLSLLFELYDLFRIWNFVKYFLLKWKRIFDCFSWNWDELKIFVILWQNLVKISVEIKSNWEIEFIVQWISFTESRNLLNLRILEYINFFFFSQVSFFFIFTKYSFSHKLSRIFYFAHTSDN